MTQPWWQQSVVYQIYPRSFNDSNGDGVGDLPGISARLDYLQKLGVDVVWLSPVYASPNDDNGYDISDYHAIMAEFGTLADFDALLAGMHARGIRLVMDLVVNHTSDEHAWFQQSRRSKDNPYRDWYIWRPGRDGGPPNNWGSHFGGSAWEYDPATDEYYLHLFSKKQPDLNWENPAVRRAVYDMMHWWLQRGVDGFRMDVINMISKVPGLPAAAVTTGAPYQYGGEHFLNGPRFLEFMQEMKREVLAHYDILTVGETPGMTVELARTLTDAAHGALSMVFQFEHMDIDNAPGADSSRHGHAPWRLADLKQITTRWQTGLADGGWNSNYLTNHDQPRAVSRFGDDGIYRVESAKLLATFLHMLQGTPYIYQGEEFGMTNPPYPSIADYRDIETIHIYHDLVQRLGRTPADALAIIHAKSRDNARSPIQWDASRNAGFSSGTPWIGINPDYPRINAAQALLDPDSIFYYYRALIALRKQYPLIVHGRYALILPEDAQIYAFTRTWQAEQLLVILNFSAAQPQFVLPAEIAYDAATLLIANYADAAGDPRQITLRPWEARVYRLTR